MVKKSESCKIHTWEAHTWRNGAITTPFDYLLDFMRPQLEDVTLMLYYLLFELESLYNVSFTLLCKGLWIRVQVDYKKDFSVYLCYLFSESNLKLICFLAMNNVLFSSLLWAIVDHSLEHTEYKIWHYLFFWNCVD